MHVSKKLMGQKATQRLLYRIVHPKEEVEKLVMNVEVVERDSVGVPPESSENTEEWRML